MVEFSANPQFDRKIKTDCMQTQYIMIAIAGFFPKLHLIVGE